MPKLRIAENTVDFACGETVLDALEGAGIHVPNSCRTGVCQSCLMQACSGDVPDEAQSGIGSAKRELGYFLACVCRPTSDLEVAHLGESEAITATLTAIRRCPGDVLEVRLRTATPLDYRGGQFVTLLREDGLARPYSLASVRGADELELHVRHYPGGAMSGWLATAPVGATIEVRGPLGECFYVADDLDRPLLLVGTGTGLAPLYGILREALGAGHRGPITLLHGARRASDLYHREELARLAAEHENLEVIASALSVEDADDVLATPIDTLAIKHANRLASTPARIYLCGAPELVNGLRRRLFIAGIPLRSILADAFLPAAPAKPAT